MPSTIKKSICIVIIGLIWLLPINLRRTQAQQATAPSNKAGASAAITVNELQSRRSVIEAMTDIDTSVQNESLKYIDQAISHIQIATSNKSKADELSALIQNAPERLKILQAEMKKPFTAPGTVEARAEQMDTTKLKQRTLQKEAELATAQNRLREWSDRLTAEQAIINQTPEQLAAASSRLKDLITELETISSVIPSDILNHSKKLSLESEREKLTTAINLYEMQQRSHNLLMELFTTEKEVAQKAVQGRQKMLASWQDEVQKNRQQDATQAREDAQDAIVEVPLMPKIVQDQFEINVQLSTALETMSREEADLTDRNSAFQARLTALEEEFETAKKRVEFTVLTDTIGLALRTQRLNLPGADQYLVDSEARQIKMGEISEQLIELDRLQREISNPEALADRLVDAVNFLSNAERTSLESKIPELLTSRLDIIHDLKSGYNRIFKLLQDNEFTEQRIVDTADHFGELLDRHLLWIRSSKPVHFSDIQKLIVVLGWFLEPASWGQLFKDLSRSIRQNTTIWVVGLAIAVYLIYCRRQARKKLKDIAESVEQQVEDSFRLTGKALGLTVLLAAVWPFLLAFPASQLLRLHQADRFSAGISGGLVGAVYPLSFLVLFYNICRQNGLAQAHFQWPDTVRRTLKRNVGWLCLLIPTFTFFLASMEAVPEFEYGDILAKLALTLNALALSAFAANTLRFKGGITSRLIKKYPQSWLCRLRYIWYPLAILTPIFILGLAAIGYYYSALEIGYMVRDTVALILTLIVFNDLMRRLLMLARRRIALKKAIANQELALDAASHPDAVAKPGDGSPASMMDSIVGMNKIDEQTRKLLKLTLFILGLAGIWTIWNSVFPAFGILQDVHFWSYSTVVDGVATTVPITLANICLAIVVVVTTVIASRNLPGLLEVILLNRLPMDPGARYAYSTVSRYAITAIGIIIAFNTIGIKWDNLQWLVAALSVGLGFGLQEIVANFICGLIVLFERPFRVGDTVTIADISGTVSRIRIRATTVVDWDHKELIVPNKEFVVGRLINWSLTEQLIRFKIPVGIAYGSDTELAEKLLLKVAHANRKVLNSPAPRAVFLSFGDNTLKFELRVYVNNIDDWIPMLHSMNLAIDKEFRKAGITIAFPQRDVHLDATGPLDVRVVMENPASGDPDRPPGIPKEPES